MRERRFTSLQCLGPAVQLRQECATLRKEDDEVPSGFPIVGVARSQASARVTRRSQIGRALVWIKVAAARAASGTLAGDLGPPQVKQVIHELVSREVSWVPLPGEDRSRSS